MNEIIVIEQIEVGSKFLWWDSSDFDYLCIAKFKLPFNLTYQQFEKHRLWMTLTLIPHFIYTLLGYRQITKFKIEKGHGFEEGQEVQVIYDGNKKVIEVEKIEL